MTKKNPLIGKTVVGLHIARDRQALKFDLGGDKVVVVGVDADCCSHTWIEAIQGVEQIIGSPIVSVEDVPMPELPYDHNKHDVLAFYGCKITSERGYCLIDYRNDSNGYYGGNLSWPGDHFYGGVYGQNKSRQEWETVMRQNRGPNERDREVTLRKEFEVHILNEAGIQLAGEIANQFNELLGWLEANLGEGADPRCLAITRTKLEEACFFAKKAMASNPQYQK